MISKNRSYDEGPSSLTLVTVSSATQRNDNNRLQWLSDEKHLEIRPYDARDNWWSLGENSTDVVK